eukprot:961956-Amphidinium_carterae.1
MVTNSLLFPGTAWYCISVSVQREREYSLPSWQQSLKNGCPHQANKILQFGVENIPIRSKFASVSNGPNRNNFLCEVSLKLPH